MLTLRRIRRARALTPNSLKDFTGWVKETTKVPSGASSKERLDQLVRTGFSPV